MIDEENNEETPEAPVFERAPRVVGGLRSGRRGPSWLAVAIICVSIILLVSLWGLLRPVPDPAGAQPAFVTTPASTTGTGAAATPARTAARPGARDVRVTLRYAGASWTRVTADGRLAFEGTPSRNQRRTFRAKRSLSLVLGYPAVVRVTLNGRDLGVADRSGNIWRGSFTPGSRSLG